MEAGYGPPFFCLEVPMDRGAAPPGGMTAANATGKEGVVASQGFEPRTNGL